MTPRIATIHDLSGFGRCSLTVAIPILSAMGLQCCPLQTAFLSTHTGGFSNYAFLDMTAEMEKTAVHWKSLNIEFQAIYTGFLGSSRQIDIVIRFIDEFRRNNTIVVVDPVMGDDGAIYSTYTKELCEGMSMLANSADVITPNLTEAALLLGIEYDELKDARRALEAAEQLGLNGKRSVVLTGVSSSERSTGAACFDANTGKKELIETQRIPQDFYGTGDVFASVLTGALVRGENLPCAVRRAVEFTRACSERTAKEKLPMSEGLDFEPLLHMLIESPTVK